MLLVEQGWKAGETQAPGKTPAPKMPTSAHQGEQAPRGDKELYKKGKQKGGTLKRGGRVRAGAFSRRQCLKKDSVKRERKSGHKKNLAGRN